ncbi:MAG: hypothetical protein CL927_06930 [Deltaproteobacteria bacterium]|nr:hypothetical protein [Deltaproteobacteria bacterium]HCH67001.1 hypothetical protein [Deltaproteobacteria bacterium]
MVQQELEGTDGWVHLMDMGGHEVIMGPLQERLQVSFFDHGVILRRKGFVGSTYGAYEASYAYSQVQEAPSGGGVWISDPRMERPAHHIVGSGGRLLRLILGLLDDDRSGGVVAAPGSATTRFGLLIRGMVVGGPHGILLVPNGLYGLLPGGLLRLDLDEVASVLDEGDALVLHTTSSRLNTLRLMRDDLSMPRFATWWARMIRGAAPEMSPGQVLPVLWWQQSEKLQQGCVRLVNGGIRLESDDETSELASSGLLTFLLPSRDTGTHQHTIRMQVRGREHELWMLGGDDHKDVLLRHLREVSHTAWPDDFDGGKWDACDGSWSSARIREPGKAEIVLRSVRVERTAMGLLVRHEHAPDVSLLAPQIRRRIFLELIQPRRRLRMRVVHRGVRREREDRDSPESFSHKLMPLGSGPEVLSSRRVYYRVEASTPVIVQLFDPARSRPIRSELVDLSATGIRVRVFEAYTPSEDLIQVRIASGAHRKLKLQGEILHASRHQAGTDVGIRFAKLNENVRSVIQREVLRLEREALHRPAEQELMEDGALRIRPTEPFFEEPTLDYT